MTIEPFDEVQDAALKELGQSSDRAAAVLAGAMLEDQLIELIEKSILDDQKPSLRNDPSGYYEYATWA